MAKLLINTLDACNPLFLQANDHSNLPIVGFKLIGSDNYKMWSTAMKIALKGKNKIGIIDGTCVKPVTSVVLAQQWERCNAIILGWILGSLSQELEFDILTLLPSCTCAAHEGVLKHNQLVRLMQFLTGLNDVEESHRGLALGKLSAKSPVTFVVRTNNGNNNFNKRVSTNNDNNRGPNLNLVCKYCGLIRHTIERCYELNGYPAGFKMNPNLSKLFGFVKKFNGNNVDVS
ncbi:ribonuclease H-like domain-containing protein [Tanacetum coccineum]|uniref:Ribonuclease H-like domain-containing protein n=1 Tax=Tanacetum coccineum TaxID=301880 RepID=A0ABQ5DQ12_9ASTR